MIALFYLSFETSLNVFEGIIYILLYYLGNDLQTEMLQVTLS